MFLNFPLSESCQWDELMDPTLTTRDRFKLMVLIKQIVHSLQAHRWTQIRMCEHTCDNNYRKIGRGVMKSSKKIRHFISSVFKELIANFTAWLPGCKHQPKTRSPEVWWLRHGGGQPQWPELSYSFLFYYGLPHDQIPALWLGNRTLWSKKQPIS